MSNLPSQLDPLDATSGASESLLELESQAQVAQRAHRLHRIKLSIFSALLIRPLSVVIPIVTIPLFLKYLGAERYGLYEAIGALALYLSMSNAGLTLGLINKLTDCDVRQDREAARIYTSTLTVTMVVFTIITMAIVTVLAIGVDWQRVFETTDPRARSEVPWAFWTAGTCVIVGLLIGIAPAIYAAYQETHRNNIWDGIAKVASLVACFVVVHTSWGLVGVILALSGVPAAVRLVNLVDLFLREKPWLRPDLRKFQFRALGSLASQGLLLFILAMSTVLLFQTDKLIIGVLLTPTDVTVYAIIGRVFLTAYGVYMMLLTPLWPASGDAVRRGDLAWLRKSLRISMLAGCGIMLLCGIALLIGGNKLLHLLPGGAGLHASKSLILAMTCAFIARAWVDGRSIILNSAEVLVPQTFFYGGHAAINVVVAIALGRVYGVEGVAWATPITALATSVWGYPWLVQRYIFNPQRPREARGFAVVQTPMEKS